MCPLFVFAMITGGAQMQQNTADDPELFIGLAAAVGTKLNRVITRACVIECMRLDSLVYCKCYLVTKTLVFEPDDKYLDST